MPPPECRDDAGVWPVFSAVTASRGNKRARNGRLPGGLTRNALVSKESPPCFLPVICFWRKLSKSLISHGNCPFLRNSLPVFVGKCPCFGAWRFANPKSETRK